MRHTRKNRLPEHMMTYRGLHQWHEAMYEKLGWMLLASAKGRDYKLQTYKKSIDHLITSIKHLAGEYQDPDRKHDLNVLLIESEFLKSVVEKNL